MTVFVRGADGRAVGVADRIGVKLSSNVPRPETEAAKPRHKAIGFILGWVWAVFHAFNVESIKLDAKFDEQGYDFTILFKLKGILKAWAFSERPRGQYRVWPR